MPDTDASARSLLDTILRCQRDMIVHTSKEPTEVHLSVSQIEQIQAYARRMTCVVDSGYEPGLGLIYGLKPAPTDSNDIWVS